MKRVVVLLILPVSLLYSCSGEAKKSANNPASAQQSVAPASSIHNRIQASATPPPDRGIFDRYNAVKQVVREWNAAIDGHHPEKLKDLYADQVMCYLEKKSAAAVVADKTAWLKKHGNYRQQLKHVDVYYNEDDTTLSHFKAEFTKICTENGKTTEIQSWLHFERINGFWKIVTETDAPTEVARANKAKNRTLKKGTHQFYRGHWVDTRDDESLAHDQVPYRFAFELEIGDKVTGSFWWYSGRLRSVTEYLVTDGKMQNGILELTLVWNGEEEYTLEDYEPGSEEEETWRFRIVSENEIVGIDKDNPYTYGVSFPRSGED
jgi:hypothetical protein